MTYDFYKDDASQYDVEHSLKIRRIYDIMPSYMENKVKRIKFKQIENKEDSNLIKYKDEFDYVCNSNNIINEIEGNENELFKRIFVKINDCPEWMRLELYEIRQKQLKEEQKIEDEKKYKEMKKQKRLELRNKIFPFLKK